MDVPNFSRKRPLWDGHEGQNWPHTKRCFTELRVLEDRFPYQTPITAPQSCRKCQCPHQSSRGLCEQLSSWTDYQLSVIKVLQHICSKQAISNFLLSDSVSRKFLSFHLDVTGEFGPEDKQHSWAVLEKQEEVIMYGLYYPDYSLGEHSEDLIIRQTQELIESDLSDAEGCKVYIFSMNSPCLARKDEPCMLKLIHKAEEWWKVHKVKTHIGYIRSWGFKGNKENVFKDITYKQIECIHQSVDYESYRNISSDLNPLCETVFCVAKQLLMSEEVNTFPLTTTVQKQDRKSYFKNMHSISEGRADDGRTIQEIKRVLEAAEALLSELTEMTLEEYRERGDKFVCEFIFSSEVCDALKDEFRRTFELCWSEMVEDMHAEFIRSQLTGALNRRAVQLFVRDVISVTKEYLQIGKLQILEEDPKLLR